MYGANHCQTFQKKIATHNLNYEFPLYTSLLVPRAQSLPFLMLNELQATFTHFSVFIYVRKVAHLHLSLYLNVTLLSVLDYASLITKNDVLDGC